MDMPTAAPKKLVRKEGKVEPVAGKRTIIVGKKSTLPVKKKAATLCKAHKKKMVYDAVLGWWKCPEDGCGHKSRPKVGGESGAPTVIKGEPKLIVNYDEDGDPHYLLQYDDLNVVVELPFNAVMGHKVYNSTATPSVVVNVKTSNVVFVGNDGKLIPIERAKDK